MNEHGVLTHPQGEANGGKSRGEVIGGAAP